MRYNKAITFDKAEEELDKALKGEKKRVEQTAFDKYWEEIFKDRVETLYIIMDDKTPFRYTSDNSETIDLNAGALDSWLKQVRGEEYSLKNVKLIIHNHLKNSRFSDIDLREHYRLKKLGFKGHFMIYSHMTKKTYEDKLDTEKNKVEK